MIAANRGARSQDSGDRSARAPDRTFEDLIGWHPILSRELDYGDSRPLMTLLEEVSRPPTAYTRAIETPGF
jgi:hypothetical protein